MRIYKPELVTLCIGIAALAIPWTLQWLLRYVRAWWAGITSMGAFLAAIGTIWAIGYWRIYSTVGSAIWVVSITALLVTDFWRQRPRQPQAAQHDLKLNIPIGKIPVIDERRWAARASDDPISDWADDVVGRATLVEVLADHALRQRTPVVALHGGLGDGKSSVLNLLRYAVGGTAIVVSFRAWLPGSETTLAADLFNDIVSECRRRVLVPQLRKRALVFARTISGSMPHFAGLKELIPSHSQREEIEELHETLSRVPMPILILLDEIDRMQRDELLVLLKVLRGASSIPNVTFVCAFSEEDVKRELDRGASLPHDYLEKFFPVSIRMSPPAPEIIARCMQARLLQRFAEQKWFRSDQDKANFADLLDHLWAVSLQRVCTNLRKAGLLVNDILAAGGPITGEVNPLDLVGIEAIRRFYPEIYRLVRTNAEYLTYASMTSLLTEDNDSQNFFATMDREVDKLQDPVAVRTLLGWLFPKYALACSKKSLRFADSKRPTNEDIAEDEKRICSPNYFQIYFRAAIPEEMFSNAELDHLISNLNESRTEDDVKAAFGATLDSIAPGHAKREDFLWKLARGMERLNAYIAESLAYAVASRAADYRYDLMHVGEGARAINIIFVAAQKLSATPVVQQALEGAMTRASDDTFAIRLLEFTENRSRNNVLTEFSHVDVSRLKGAFIQRMRDRYAQDSDVNLSQADWQALRRWVENSEDDRQLEQNWFRSFIGHSRKRLAQAINVIYPGGAVVWQEDPTSLMNRFFPTDEIKDLLRELPNDEALDETERKALARIQDLFEGKYPTLSNLR
jgi:hypothetical protein